MTDGLRLKVRTLYATYLPWGGKTMNPLSIGKPRPPVKQKQTAMNMANLLQKQDKLRNHSPKSATLGTAQNTFPQAT
jgi:hypothetical protein